MKRIPIRKRVNGKIKVSAYAFVDDEDHEILRKYKWFRCGAYAARRGLKNNGIPTNIKMHNEVFGNASKGMKIDHKDRNPLNNQKSNLRFATSTQNRMNQAPINLIGLKGVTWHKRDKVWQASIKKNYRGHHIGSYQNKKDAALAYDKKAKELFGEFAYLNYPNYKHDKRTVHST